MRKLVCKLFILMVLCGATFYLANARPQAASPATDIKCTRADDCPAEFTCIGGSCIGKIGNGTKPPKGSN